MKNPWENILLSDYESHMKLDSVFQLQSMNQMMKEQFNACPTPNMMILGIAGGNGLEHILPNQFEKIYGVDINPSYLEETARRYPELDGILECLCVDLLTDADLLPQSDLLIANLLIEYIGYEAFSTVIQSVKPQYVSCIIQINTENSWVSDSPYLHVFDELELVHHQMEEDVLKKYMLKIGYCPIKTLNQILPNRKKLVQIDFAHISGDSYE